MFFDRSNLWPGNQTPPITFVGGVAIDLCPVHLLEEALDTALIVPDNPHIVGAYGAALLA